MRGPAVALAAIIAVMGLVEVESARQDAAFAARLSPVPITVAMQDQVAGQGAATGSLAGDRLTIAGTFEGLRSPATVARLHVAPRGIRGPAVADLTVDHATSGTIAGNLELSDRQAAALREGSLYIQIHSEKAPEGNLWGWLFPQEVKQ